jgi:hypothetical protein
MPIKLPGLATELAKFENHKPHLIGALRELHAGSDQMEDDAWHALRRAAYFYLLRTKTPQETMRPVPAKQLNDLAEALKKTQRLVHDAISNGVGIDLLRVGYETKTSPTAGITIDEKTGKLNVPFFNRLATIANELKALHTVAQEAKLNISTKRGRPSGSGLLSAGDGVALRAICRRWSGKEPPLRGRRFLELVRLFVIAVADPPPDYDVSEAMKYMKRKATREAANFKLVR